MVHLTPLQVPLFQSINCLGFFFFLYVLLLILSRIKSNFFSTSSIAVVNVIFIHYHYLPPCHVNIEAIDYIELSYTWKRLPRIFFSFLLPANHHRNKLTFILSQVMSSEEMLTQAIAYSTHQIVFQSSHSCYSLLQLLQLYSLWDDESKYFLVHTWLCVLTQHRFLLVEQTTTSVLCLYNSNWLH